MNFHFLINYLWWQKIKLKEENKKINNNIKNINDVWEYENCEFK